MKRNRRITRALSLALVFGLLAGGCASSDPAPANEGSAPPKGTGTPALPAVSAGALEGFSEESKAYLEGKDFSGQTLVVGVWGGDYEEIIRDVVIPPLEAQGAEVQLLLGGAGDRLAKLYAEKSSPSMDVAYINVHTAPQAVTDGVAEAADKSLPVYADLYDFAKEAGGYGAAIAPVGIQYNKDVFSEPPTWEDLFQPEYAGKIAFPTWPSTGSDALLGIVGRMLGGDEHDTDAIIQKLQELKPVPLVYTSNDELAQYISQGLVVAAPNQSSYAEALNEQYDNLGFVLPSEPCSVLAMDTIVITEGTKNRDLALAYVQLALDPKTQTVFAEKAYFSPTNSKVTLSDSVSEKVVDGEEVASLINLDWPFIVQIRKELTERWNKDLLE